MEFPQHMLQHFAVGCFVQNVMKTVIQLRQLLGMAFSGMEFG